MFICLTEMLLCLRRKEFYEDTKASHRSSLDELTEWTQWAVDLLLLWMKFL